MIYKKPIVSSVHYPHFTSSLSNLSGKTFVITGTTSGTGRVAAKTLAEGGGRVIMLNRDSERAVSIQAELEALQTSAEVITISCDLQRFASVQAAAEQVIAYCPNGIYALINNAGIMAMADEATEDGFDVQMQTNHLSHFLLTRELFPLLQLGGDHYGESRVVNHSSIARLAVRRLEAKYLERRGGQLGGDGSSMVFMGARWVRYAQTKLANAAFTAALHHRLLRAHSKVRALIAHPGFANTELQVTTHREGGMSGWGSLFARFISQSEEDGALGILTCATSSEAESGTFYGPGRTMIATRGEARPFALEKRYNNGETIDMIWEKSCEAIGKEFII